MNRKGLALSGTVFVVLAALVFLISADAIAYAANQDCDASWYIGSVNGNTATVVMTPDTNFACDVYLTSWQMFDPLPNTGTQVKFAQIKKVSPKGGSTPITFSVPVPNCAWQVDLSSVPVGSASDYNGHNLINFDFGGGELCGSVTVCGNGHVEGDEECDDGNQNPLDQCSNQCTITYCSDGYVQHPNGQGQNEQCDDGNTHNGDGCSSTCHTEPPPQVCGNGVVETGEQCDDGNQNPADQCSNQCTLTYCPDGIVQNPNGYGGYEYCDDGNQNNNDLCSNQCIITYCGDGIVQNPNGLGQQEQCDDSNTQDGDGCSSQCQYECLISVTKTDSPDPVAHNGTLKYTLKVKNYGTMDCSNTGIVVKETYDPRTMFISSVPAPSVGSNQWNFASILPGKTKEINITVKVNATAQCSSLSNKACATKGTSGPQICDIEPTGVNCPPPPVCGNGVIEPGEQCDDGNTQSGDGCSSTCQLECLLNITKTDKPDPVSPNGILNYTLHVTNYGTSDCKETGVKVKEYYDIHTLFVNAVPAPTYGNNVWKFPSIPAGKFKEINITVKVLSSTPECSLLKNKACTYKDYHDFVYVDAYGSPYNDNYPDQICTKEYTNTTCPQLYCGDGIVTPPEMCELPNTRNNPYCPQSTQTCRNNQTGTRDTLGACDGVCGCSYDPFVYQCIQGTCGAVCDSPDDYQLDNGICQFGCSDNSCSYENSCSTDSYCSGPSNNTYYFNGQCSGDGCSFTPMNCDMMDTQTNVTVCIDEHIINKTIFNDFSCGPGGCINTTTEINTTVVIDCNSLDGWYNTTETRWLPDTSCTEKEQLRQLYRNYTCSAYNETNCSFAVTDERWIDTGMTRPLPDGTSCSDGLFCNGNEVCYVGVCTPGPPIVCNDNNTCTNDYCNEETDMCDYIPTGNGTANVTKVYGTPFYFNGTSEWINSSTIINMTASADACFVNLSILYRVTLMNDTTCYSDSICQNSTGTGSWNAYNGTFTINETSCHLIEFFVNGSTPTPIKKQCPFVDNSGPIPNKTVEEPNEKIYPETYNWTFYPWVNGKCWTGNESIDCWKVSTMTPVNMSCADDEPHPVGQQDLCFNVELDGDDYTETYCDIYGGSLDDGYCCVNKNSQVITFGEESEHNLKYYCTDKLGNAGPIDDEKFKVDGDRFTIKLNKKWNLISVPFVLHNNSPEKIFGPIADKVQSVWTYDAENHVWQVYTPDGVANDDIVSVEPGRGYWVLALNSTTLIIDGSLFNPIVVPPSHSVIHGWNLLGYYGNEDENGNMFFNYTGPAGNGKEAKCALYSLGDNVFDKGYTAVFTYWELLNPHPWVPLNATDRMDPGAGYWVFATEDTIYAPTTLCPDA